MEEIIERQLLIRVGAFTAFSIIEKPLASRKKSFRGPPAGPCVVPACPTLWVCGFPRIPTLFGVWYFLQRRFYVWLPARNKSL